MPFPKVKYMTEGRTQKEFLGLFFDNITLPQAVERILENRSAPFSFVVTPNVDHVVRLKKESQRNPGGLESLYEQADMCLCDSRVLGRLARHYDVDLTVVPGSDLTAAVLRTLDAQGGTVAIVGGSADTIARLQFRFSNIRFTQHMPPMGLRHNPQGLARAAEFARSVSAHCTLLAVGSPQQEMIAARIKRTADATGVGLCVGASIDFLSGKERRAPPKVQKAGLEWAFRLAGNPRRLWKRYLVDGPRIFVIAHRWSRSRRSAQPRTD
jgi:exopolysaccharide biosynthesis WecB/TagA/CpsF family protein